MHLMLSLCFALSLLHVSTTTPAYGRTSDPSRSRKPHPETPGPERSPRLIPYWERQVTTCKPCSDGLSSLSRKYGDQINEIGSTEKWIPVRGGPQGVLPCRNPGKGGIITAIVGDSSIDGCCHQQCAMAALTSAMNPFGKMVSLHQGAGSQTQLFHTCICSSLMCASSSCSCEQGQRLVLALTSPTSFEYVYINSCCRSVMN